MFNRSRFSGGRSNSRRSFSQFRRFGGNRKPSDSSIHAYIKRATTSRPQVQMPVIEADLNLEFSQLEIHDQLKQNIMSRGYTKLMPIQAQGIAPILAGQDVIGIANTGTGKTAAFLIPLVQNIIKDPTYRALIITPTRELAMQIRSEMREFSRGIAAYSTLCIGQQSIRNQISELRRDPHVIVGTPGRLKDLIERKVIKLQFFRMIVLDEADQMLDMGFINDIKHIISFLPKDRQSLFFSATVSPAISQLIQSFVKNPVTISVKTQETLSQIKQEIVQVTSGKTKSDVLEDLLKNQDLKKVLVFGRTKIGVEKLSRKLFQQGFKVTSIHGDKRQYERQQAIRMFKEDAVRILIATDVAARGLDIPDVSHVINFDVPATYEDYIHRIGRTGRANKAGIAMTIIESAYTQSQKPSFSQGYDRPVRSLNYGRGVSVVR